MKLNVVKTSNQRHPLSDFSDCCDSCEQYNEETETCEWCRFDLDHSGMIDPDDLDTPVWNKCWARIILTGNPDYEECLACNFDDVFGGSGVGDPHGYVIGTGDFGVWSGYNAKTCEECGEDCWSAVDPPGVGFY